MLSTYRGNVVRIQKQINDLQKKDGEERKKAAEALRRMNAAQTSASKASSPGSAKTYLSTAEREAKSMQDAYERQARIAHDISTKASELERAQAQVAAAEEKERKDLAALAEKRRKEDDNARKALADANAKLRRDYESRIRNLEAQITAAIEQRAADAEPFEVANADDLDSPYDFFVSHAWKDKESFVDGLVSKAEAAGLSVWYDRQAIAWGDSIRQKIEAGLRQSYFGVVVLSPNFFERPWPQMELDAIIQRDLSGKGRVLPIWHKLTQDEIEDRVPSLAGRLALSTASSNTDSIVQELLNVREQFKAAVDRHRAL